MKKLLLLITLATGFSFLSGQTVNQITERTKAFVHTLSEDELQIIYYNYDDTLRTKWSNFPIGLAERQGIKFGKLSAESKIAFHHFLTTLLSSQGYLKTTSIMQLDDILNEIYETAYTNNEIDEEMITMIRDLKWKYENYFISIWGKPDSHNPWSLKFEGHHISLNVSVIGNELALMPLFLGTDPAEVHKTKYAGIRVLSKEEDYGFLLINSLSKEQKNIVTLNKEVPEDIITNSLSTKRITEYYGIKAGDLSDKQKDILVLLIREYVFNLEQEKAWEYLNRIEKSGIDEIYFAWIGSYESQKPHYYIIHGPDFIIEYDNRGFQNNGNHIHTIWREKGNDFGEDLLKKHYQDHKHTP